MVQNFGIRKTLARVKASVIFVEPLRSPEHRPSWDGGVAAAHSGSTPRWRRRSWAGRGSTAVGGRSRRAAWKSASSGTKMYKGLTKSSTHLISDNMTLTKMARVT